MRAKIDVLTRTNVQINGKSDPRHTLLFAHGFGTDQSARFQSDYRTDLKKLFLPRHRGLLVLPTEGRLPLMHHRKEVTQAIRTFVDQIPEYGLESF